MKKDERMYIDGMEKRMKLLFLIERKRKYRIVNTYIIMPNTPENAKVEYTPDSTEKPPIPP
ncbi:hypothetical protein LNO14_25060 [Klebsiella pneumoniae subsp. pneumoniae]|nr:hypothetical protein [Klebsiella pneumoniae subsp. pneumoniae]